VRKRKGGAVAKRERVRTLHWNEELVKDAERLTSCCGCVLHASLVHPREFLMRFAAPRKKERRDLNADRAEGRLNGKAYENGRANRRSKSTIMDFSKISLSTQCDIIFCLSYLNFI